MGHDELAAGLQELLVLPNEILQEIPRQYQVIIGLLLDALLAHDWNMVAWGQPADLELIHFDRHRHQIRANPAVVHESASLHWRSQGVHRFLFFFENPEESHEAFAVVFHISREVKIGLQPEKPGAFLRIDRDGDTLTGWERAGVLCHIKNEGTAMHIPELNVQQPHPVLGKKFLQWSNRINTSVLMADSPESPQQSPVVRPNINYGLRGRNLNFLQNVFGKILKMLQKGSFQAGDVWVIGKDALGGRVVVQLYEPATLAHRHGEWV